MCNMEERAFYSLSNGVIVHVTVSGQAMLPKAFTDQVEAEDGRSKVTPAMGGIETPAEDDHVPDSA